MLGLGIRKPITSFSYQACHRTSNMVHEALLVSFYIIKEYSRGSKLIERVAQKEAKHQTRKSHRAITNASTMMTGPLVNIHDWGHHSFALLCARLCECGVVQYLKSSFATRNLSLGSLLTTSHVTCMNAPQKGFMVQPHLFALASLHPCILAC